MGARGSPTHHLLSRSAMRRQGRASSNTCGTVASSCWPHIRMSFYGPSRLARSFRPQPSPCRPPPLARRTQAGGGLPGCCARARGGAATNTEGSCERPRAVASHMYLTAIRTEASSAGRRSDGAAQQFVGHLDRDDPPANAQPLFRRQFHFHHDLSAPDFRRPGAEREGDAQRGWSEVVDLERGGHKAWRRPGWATSRTRLTGV